MRYVALLTTAITFIVSLGIWINFDNAQSGFQMVERHEWIREGRHRLPHGR